jgi:hypothetical protein
MHTRVLEKVLKVPAIEYGRVDLGWCHLPLPHPRGGVRRPHTTGGGVRPRGGPVPPARRDDRQDDADRPLARSGSSVCAAAATTDRENEHSP